MGKDHSLIKKDKLNETILDDETSFFPYTKEDLPKPTSDWIPSEEDLTIDKNDENPIDYIIPKDLPTAVNDWLTQDTAEDEFDFTPEKDINYKKPKKLPSPIRDWKPKD